ncbi:hypothetical protein Ancab_003847 [Ancistrocladus abbreviatus]
MLELCRRPLVSCFGVGDGGNGNENEDDAVWELKLKQYASGEYSMAVVQANSSLEDQAQVFSSPYATYIGVYDGHGGPYASRFIKHRIFSLLDKFALEESGLSTNVIKKAFNATEEEFLQWVRKAWITDPNLALSGSCCLLGGISDGILYMANLGDSRAVLGRKVHDGRMFYPPSVVAERLTSDHNVGNKEVRKEVRALHPDDPQIVVYTRGFWRIKGIIQVSRAIGDIYLKRPEFSNLYRQFGSPAPLKRAVIAADPAISTRELKADDLFVIFASDGLWEHLSDEAAVEIVFRSPRVGIAKRLARAALEEAARKFGLTYEDMGKIEKGLRRHFHDDITVVVVYLDNASCPANGRRKDHCGIDFCNTPVDVISFHTGDSDGIIDFFS